MFQENCLTEPASPLPEETVADADSEGGINPAPAHDSQHPAMILRRLRRITKAINTHSHGLWTQWKITEPQWGCLKILADKSPLSAAALSREALISQSSLVGILDRLERGGLVRRERGTRDRRETILHLSDRGREVARTTPEPLQSSIADALKVIPPEERTALIRSLDWIAETLEHTLVKYPHNNAGISQNNSA